MDSVVCHRASAHWNEAGCKALPSWDMNRNFIKGKHIRALHKVKKSSKADLDAVTSDVCILRHPPALAVCCHCKLEMTVLSSCICQNAPAFGFVWTLLAQGSCKSPPGFRQSGLMCSLAHLHACNSVKRYFPGANKLQDIELYLV